MSHDISYICRPLEQKNDDFLVQHLAAAVWVIHMFFCEEKNGTRNCIQIMRFWSDASTEYREIIINSKNKLSD